MTDVDKLNQAIAKGMIDTSIYAYEIDGDIVRITTPYRTVTVDLSPPMDKVLNKRQPATKAKE